MFPTAARGNCAPRRWSAKPASHRLLNAISPGIPVAQINLGGVGQLWNPPPLPGCIPVFIGSDSEGMFGAQCPACGGYWRCRIGPTACPYCGIRAERHEFLTTAQRNYVQQYCRRLNEALAAKEDGDHIIDMDAVSDAVGIDAEKPPFYYAEESQQNRFTCKCCGEFSDILGTFGYCSACGTRNDLQQLEDHTIPLLRERINSGGPYEFASKTPLRRLPPSPVNMQGSSFNAFP